MNGLSFTILPNKALKISADAGARTSLRRAYNSDGYPEALKTFFATAATSGFHEIKPKDIAALTDAPILGKDLLHDAAGELKSVGSVWWFPDYAVKDEMHELIDKGEVVFNFAPAEID